MNEIVMELVTKNRGGLNPEVNSHHCFSCSVVITCVAVRSVLNCHPLLLSYVLLVSFLLSSYSLVHLVHPLFPCPAYGVSGTQRVMIGLRALLVIADSLEKKEGDPPMPHVFSSMSSGSTSRMKTKFLNTTLTESIAKKIGLSPYCPQLVHVLYLPQCAWS